MATFTGMAYRAVLRAAAAVILGEVFNCWGSHFTLFGYQLLWSVLVAVELFTGPPRRNRVNEVDMYDIASAVIGQLVYLFAWIFFMEVGRLVDVMTLINNQFY